MNTGSKIKNIKTTDCHLKSSGHNFGGGGGRLYDFSVISDYLVSDAACVSAESKFRYVAHVDNAALLEYPLSQYVHTHIPITGLLEFLPLMHCRKIASIHGISAGSCCNLTQLASYVENHSCSKCSSYFTVFSI